MVRHVGAVREPPTSPLSRAPGEGLGVRVLRLWGDSFERRELLRRVGGLEQVAGVRLVTLGDGNERGVRVLEFRTGTGFAFDVLVDRAFDIGRSELGGKAIGWHSGVGFGGPWFEEHDLLGWLRN